ncbi:hypothetical protein HK100_001975, partial [Physocladia obscura]
RKAITVPKDSYTFQALIGLLLSDMHVSTARSRSVGVHSSTSSRVPNSRLQFGQDWPNVLFFWHVFVLLMPYCSVFPYTGKGTKVVPAAIYDLMTPVALAYLIMGDGTFHTRDGVLVLCTEGFTEADNVRLMEVLSTKFGLNCQIEKRPQGSRITKTSEMFQTPITCISLHHSIYARPSRDVTGALYKTYSMLGRSKISGTPKVFSTAILPIKQVIRITSATIHKCLQLI